MWKIKLYRWLGIEKYKKLDGEEVRVLLEWAPVWGKGEESLEYEITSSGLNKIMIDGCVSSICESLKNRGYLFPCIVRDYEYGDCLGRGYRLTNKGRRWIRANIRYIGRYK